MRRRHVLAALPCLGLAACGGQGGTRSDGGSPPPSLDCPSRAYAGPPVRAALADAQWPTDAMPSQVDLPFGDRLDQALDALLLPARLVGVDAALSLPGDGRWSRRTGYRDLPARLVVDRSTEFWWASVGKLVTASLVMDAERLGMLRLDDVLSRWQPAMPQASQIRIVDLLDHTCGLLSYNHPSALGDGSVLKYLEPARLLAPAQARGLLSCPGTQFGYTNTGYLLLGLILESVWAKPFDALVEDHLRARLGAHRLRALRPGEISPSLAHSHRSDGTVLPQPGLSSLLGAGNLVGDAAAWVTYLQNVLTVDAAAAARRRFERLLPMGLEGAGRAWYGLGVMTIDWSDKRDRTRLWLGHTGGGTGANAVVFWDPLLKVYGAVAVNSPAPAAAVANTLLSALEDALA